MVAMCSREQTGRYLLHGLGDDDAARIYALPLPHRRRRWWGAGMIAGVGVTHDT